MRRRIEPGQRYTLPSGRCVELLVNVQRDYRAWSCAYLEGEKITPPGSGQINRVTLTAEFLERVGQLQ